MNPQGIVRTLSATPSDTISPPTDRELVEHAVDILARTAATDGDDDFPRICVRALAQVYRTRFAVAGTFADKSRRTIKTLAVWAGDDFGENFTYHLDGMPCDDILKGHLQLIPDRLSERYPQDVLLKGLGVQSYLGVALIGADGEVMGVLSVMNDEPLQLSEQTSRVLNLFAGRLAAELERREARVSLQHHVFELETAQQALTTSEARYRELFDHAPIGLWEDDWSQVKPMVDQLDLDGADLLLYLERHPEFVKKLAPLTRRANAAAVAMYRAPSSYILCKYTNEALWSHGEYESFCRTLAAFVDGKFSVCVEDWERTFDHGDIFVRDTVVIPQAFRGDWSRVIHSTEDHTAQRRTETLLSTERQLLELIARRTSLAEIMNRLCRLTEDQMPGAMCSILLLDSDGARLRTGAAPSLPADYAKALDGLQIGECAGSCGTAAYHRKRVIVSDISTDPLWVPFRELAAQFGIKACWSTPVFAQNGDVLGTLALSHTRVRSPNDWDLTVMDNVNHLASIAIERGRAEQSLHDSEESLRLANEQIAGANEALERRVAKRTLELEAEKAAIRGSETRFRDLTGLSSDWYWEQDAELRFTLISGMTMLDTKREEAIGKTRWDLGYVTAGPGWAEHKAVCEARMAFRDFEFQVTDEAGELYDIRISGKPIYQEDGKFAGYRGVGQDITEGKRALVALQESETRHRQAAEIAHLGYWIWDDIEDKLADVSEEAAAMYGFTVAEFLAHSRNRINDDNLVHPDDRASYVEQVCEAGQCRSTYDLEYRVNTTDGRTRS